MEEKRKRPRRSSLWSTLWDSYPAICSVVSAFVLTMVILFMAGLSVKIYGSPAKDPVPSPTPEILVVRYATPEEQAERDRQMVEALAQTVWGEARGCSTTEQAAVVWCILNRVDSPDCPNDPLMVVQQKGQFDGYDPDYPVESEMVALVEDVLTRWELEDGMVGDIGRILPEDYLFFEGDGTHNYFRQEYIKTGETWDWSLPSPYEKSRPGR